MSAGCVRLRVLFKAALTVLCLVGHLSVPAAELLALQADAAESTVLSSPAFAAQSRALPRGSAGDELSRSAPDSRVREPLGWSAVETRTRGAIDYRAEPLDGPDRTQGWLRRLLTRADEDPPA